ncbi:gag-pol polyprotein [Lasius niger]|uniref:Gag-pol polyprotein n=1 Tax=Lasius niger TaxID=67767 RepID=A0A0J7KBN2_LASNI|nr:gag-pol polyprotein [Lasius niger]
MVISEEPCKTCVLEKQSGRKIKAIRTDNGREYVNCEFKEFLRSEGIRHQTTVPYNPQQNGLAERANRTIVERARTMLIDAGLDKGYWAEATFTVVYLVNRSPSKPLNENKFLNNEDNQERNELQAILTSDKLDDEDEPPHTSNSLIKEESEDDEFHESSDGMSTPKTTTETGLTNEPGPRRSNRTWKPVVKEGYISYLTIEEKNEDPITMDEALKSRKREHWIQAINREFKSLDENDTWEIADKPDEATLLNTKWIFKKKKTEDGETKYKARLVIQGCAQTKGIDYEETFSPVAKYSSIRYLFALAAQKGLQIMHLDVETAYLNGELMEDIYITPPEGLKINKDSNNKVLKLKKAVYGLKQSGKTWNIKIDTTLKSLGMERLKSDPYDILILHEDEQTGIKMKKLMKEFKIRDLGKPQEFLGMQIERKNENEISIHQRTYIKRMLEKYNMIDCSRAKTPMEPNAKMELSKKDETLNESKMENVPYMKAVGSLLYISQISRPDIAYAVSTERLFLGLVEDREL